MNTNKDFDVIIIGAGAAGMSAAIYTLRAGLSTLVLESESFGGQIAYTPKVENYPGIQEINGAQFASDLFEQISRLGAQFDLCRVTKVESETRPIMKATSTNSEHKCTEEQVKLVWVEGKDKPFECRAVIIANGVKPRKLGLTREDELTGEGVCYCAVCDGAFFSGRPVAICGGGNTALTDALMLSSLCPKVYLIHRRNRFTAEKPLVDAVKSKANIEIIMESTVTALLGDPSLTAIEISSVGEGAAGGANHNSANNTVTNGVNHDNINSGATNGITSGIEKRTLEVDALFVATGRNPDNAFLKNTVALDERGFILANESCTTSQKGIFAAGDCRTKHLRQLTTATADGAIAGTAAAEYLMRIQ